MLKVTIILEDGGLEYNDVKSIESDCTLDFSKRKLTILRSGGLVKIPFYKVISYKIEEA